MYYIYEITNNYPGNGKTYIGQHKYSPTKTPETDGYMGSGTAIQAAIKKYGKKNFSKKILFANIETKAETDELEIRCIAEARKNGKAEYNITDGGEGVEGYRHSPETRQKLSEATTAYFSVPENRQHMSEAKIDYWSDPEVRQHQSEASTAYFSIPENRQETSEATRIGMEDPELRQHLSETSTAYFSDPENRRKVGEANIGKPAWNKGIPLTKEHRQHMSDSLKGRSSWNKGQTGVYSDETLEKIGGGTRGKIWISDGTESRHISKDEPIPPGWTRGRDDIKGQPAWNKGIPQSEEQKEKNREKNRQVQRQRAEEYRNNNPNNLPWNEFQKYHKQKSLQTTSSEN